VCVTTQPDVMHPGECFVVSRSRKSLMVRFQMEAGSDITSSTLLSFILAVIENPEALKKPNRKSTRCVVWHDHHAQKI
jgi:hypothetical protein